MKEALKLLNKPLTIRWYLFDSGYTTPFFILVTIFSRQISDTSINIYRELNAFFILVLSSQGTDVQ